MSMETRVTQLAAQIGNTLKSVNGKIGDLTALSTTDKTNLVAALNELKSSLDGIDLTSIIDDVTTSTSTTYSSTRIDQLIAQSITDLINGADGASDTLKELADQITALAQADNGLVSAVVAQTFTDPQKTQARDNIGAASQADLGQLQTDVGDTNRDFVADFNTAYLA